MSYMYNEVSYLVSFYFTLLEELGGQRFLGIFVYNAQPPYSSLSTPFVIVHAS